MPGIGISYSNHIRKSRVVYENELITYMTGLVIPLSSAWKILLNTFILSLKNGLSIANLSDFFDVLRVKGGETEESSLKNLAKNAHHATNIDALPFTQFEGFGPGDGVTQHLLSNYNPATDTVNFTLNNGSIGVYSRTNAAANYREFGGGDASAGISLAMKMVDNILYASLNTSGGYETYSPATTQGMFIVTRNGVAITDQIIYFNKTTPTLGNSSGNTVSLPNKIMLEGAYDNNGSLLQPSRRQLSFQFVGRHTTEANRDVIVDAFEALMDANGKGVI